MPLQQLLLLKLPPPPPLLLLHIHQLPPLALQAQQTQPPSAWSNLTCGRAAT